DGSVGARRAGGHAHGGLLACGSGRVAQGTWLTGVNPIGYGQRAMNAVAICVERGMLPIGGMATALPSNGPELNVAGEAIKADNKWEAEQGFLRGWVTHIFHMKVAGHPFKELRGSGWKPSAQMVSAQR